MAAKAASETVEVDGHAVTVSNPSKVLFPEAGYTKLDVVRYYLAVADGALRAAGGRPNVLVRYPNGISEEFFYQKRAPDVRPEWIEVVALQFPSGRTAEEVVPRSAAALAWMANLACLELHPHPVLAEDLDHPNELRVDLDPVPGVPWSQVRDVAAVVREVLHDFGLVGWPKTSGSRGIHVNIRIERRWTFPEVRRAAVALAREVERRAPAIATSKWWKEERHGVFIDYNQNAKDRTVAAAYSIRPRPDARVSAPLDWHEVPDVDPADFTMRTMPARFAQVGDRHQAIEAHPCSLAALIELADRHSREGLGDAPWPPQYKKQPGEPPRVQPSRARKAGSAATGARAPRARTPRDWSQATAEEKAAWKAWNPIESSGVSRRVPRHPLLEIARASRKDDALEAAERWKARHPEVAALLEPADVLVDAMRGRSSTWTRVRINLKNVPEALRASLPETPARARTRP